MLFASNQQREVLGMNSEIRKRCFKCNVEKPLSLFYKHKGMADGHLNKCKDCAKTDVRLHRRDNESVREYDRKRYKENPDRKKYTESVARKWAEKHPKRKKAQWTLNNAVRDRRIKKEPCVGCGAEKVQAHHHDYNKPLSVTWLCARCHHIFHKGASHDHLP